MHELSLAEDVLAIIEEAAEREGFARVHRVRLEVGRLSHVQPHALEFALGAVCAGTCAQDAVVEIIQVDGQGECPACAARVPVEREPAWCPACDASPLRVVAGDRMTVRDLDVAMA